MDNVTEGKRARGRRALGRGLDALLPGSESAGLLEVDLGRIQPNADQPRQHFDQKGLDELAQSIREHGVVQPLVVTRVGDDRFQIIVGERRWKAAQIAGLERVPVVVKDVSDQQTLELAIVENVQRSDLNPLEEAAAYQRLTQDFGLTQQQIAQQVGKSRVAISNTMRLLSLPEALKRALVEHRITEGHARALLGLPDSEAQLSLLERVERDDLTVRVTEELVRQLLEPKETRRAERTVDPNLGAIEDELRRALGTKVLLRPGKQGGRIVIEYYSDDEFQGLYSRLVGER